uniref:PRELI/MSF1 domain-containing protein n=1 Tax=Steinernema glaseri TaxID=37863 RepID=A0A1I8ACZ6_9BILA
MESTVKIVMRDAIEFSSNMVQQQLRDSRIGYQIRTLQTVESTISREDYRTTWRRLPYCLEKTTELSGEDYRTAWRRLPNSLEKTTVLFGEDYRTVWRRLPYYLKKTTVLLGEDYRTVWRRLPYCLEKTIVLPREDYRTVPFSTYATLARSERSVPGSGCSRRGSTFLLRDRSSASVVVATQGKRAFRDFLAGCSGFVTRFLICFAEFLSALILEQLGSMRHQVK